MTEIKILESFELEIAKLNNTAEKPVTDDSLFWLNQAVDIFVKQRFCGDDKANPSSFEQSEKRRKDLINLTRTTNFKGDKLVLIDSPETYSKYKVAYPEDFLFVINEDVQISDLEGNHKLDTCVFECTKDSYMYRITNSLTDFHYRFHKARPLRVRTNTGCLLYTDKKYNIDIYKLGYIKKPNKITLDNPFNEYTDFDDTIMPEIIKIAAKMYLENTKDQRYQTIINEVNTQE